MKRNLMTVFILALLILNTVLTGIVMFSVVSANNKTIALVNNIATVLDLELSGVSKGDSAGAPQVAVEDSEIYDIADAMTIALRPSEDGSEHYAQVSVSFSINKTNEDYKTLQPMIATNESKIKSEIIDVVGSYTKEEAMSGEAGLEEAILNKVQTLFGSDFIYEAYFRDIKFQ